MPSFRINFSIIWALQNNIYDKSLPVLVVLELISPPCQFCCQLTIYNKILMHTY